MITVYCCIIIVIRACPLLSVEHASVVAKLAKTRSIELILISRKDPSTEVVVAVDRDPETNPTCVARLYLE